MFRPTHQWQSPKVLCTAKALIPTFPKFSTGLNLWLQYLTGDKAFGSSNCKYLAPNSVQLGFWLQSPTVYRIQSDIIKFNTCGCPGVWSHQWFLYYPEKPKHSQQLHLRINTENKTSKQNWKEENYSFKTNPF